MQYLNYRWQYHGSDNAPPFAIEPEINLDLMLAADYFDI